MKFKTPRQGLALIVLLICGAAGAQSNRGSIAGSVVDSAGAAIVGAQITAQDVDTAATYQALSSSSGSFTFPELQVGPYSVTVKAPGFKTGQRTGVIVQINSTFPLNISLDPGETSQTVTINANAVNIQTDTSDIGTVVTTKQVIDLPLALGGVGA